MKLIKELVERIKNLWNVYGGIALSTLIAWLTNWSKVEMDKWASYLLLTITCISLLTFFKVILAKKKAKGISDKLAMQQKSVKTINTALHPEQVGEELGNAILFTINGGKKMKEKLKAFFKVIYGNKFTTLSLLLNILYTGLAQYLLYSDTLKDFPFFVEHKIICIIVATSISALWLILELVKDFKQLGFESLSELNEKWAERKEAKANKLTKEQRKLVKGEIDNLDTKIAEVLGYINEAEKRVKEAELVVVKYNDFKQLGLFIDENLARDFQNASGVISKNNADILTLTQDKERLEMQKANLKAKL